MRRESLARREWTAKSGYIPSLDGLRAVSIAIVLLGHMVLPTSLLGVSAFGVKIFFFISGFLITRLLLAENKADGRISLLDFYIRRILRLYPVIVVYMVLVTGLTLQRGQPVDPLDVTSVFFYFVNYLLVHHELAGTYMTLPVTVLWSLSVEEHFYLFAPLALVLVRGDARKMLAIAVGICVVSLSIRIAYAHFDRAIVDTLLIYKHSETRFDSLAFGVILACLTELPSGRRLISWLTTREAFVGGLVVLLLSFLSRDNYFEMTWRFTIQGLALFPVVAGLVFGAPFRIFNRLLNTRPFVWVGRLSYSLYVWHGGVLFLFGWLLEGLHKPALSVAELALTFVLATLSFYLIERPILGLRRRFRHDKEISENRPTSPIPAPQSP